MRARVRYARRAISDLIGIADYIRERNPRAAEAVAARIEASIAQLAMFPFIGRATDDGDMRVLPVGRYPYIVFYEVTEGEVKWSSTTFATVAESRRARVRYVRSSQWRSLRLRASPFNR